MARRGGGFTGYQRRHETRFSVRVADATARRLITAGGVGTIVAVSTVCVYLVAVVLPLFESPEVGPPRQVGALRLTAPPIEMAVDEYRTMAWSLTADAALQVCRLDTGEVMRKHELSRGARPTAHAFATFTVDDPTNPDPTKGTRRLVPTLSLGFADGTVRFGEITFPVQAIPRDDVPPEHRQIPQGKTVSFRDGLLTRTPTGYRLHRFEEHLSEPIRVTDGAPILLLDRQVESKESVFCAFTGDNRIYVQRVREQENLMTGKITLHLSGGSTPVEIPPGQGTPAFLRLFGAGDSVCLVWPGGRGQRFDVRDMDHPRMVEELNLVPEPGRHLTRLEWLLGRETLLAGDSAGRVRAWFRVRPANTRTAPKDGWKLIMAHELPGPDAPVTVISSSQRTRLATVAYGDGRIRLFHVTSGRQLTEIRAPSEQPLRTAVLAPKEDAIYGMTAEGLWGWPIDVKYPEASLATLFLAVRYEGQAKPRHTWQSTGTGGFEPKLGLRNVVFGTFKAAFYSMLFGLPLALMAAIYTSEFLHPAARSKIKPVVETMATLPSVVLGFLAALVIAKFVENAVPKVLAGIFTVPLALLVGAYLWQLVPRVISLRLARMRLALILLAVILGIGSAGWVGPWLERLLFTGDIRAWLGDSRRGSGISGWLILFVPLSAMLVAAAGALWISPAFGRAIARMRELPAALTDLLRFLVYAAATLLLALLLSWLMNRLGWDPREGSSFLGTFEQRNALVVGFAMGFAVIPIIYTIAEDALSTVPEHLRAASLGAGATPWQTAVRIVIPTAMSGLFSATMIGLGRAVGETMIILMAGGGTAIWDWNLFNGMRTLAANIATEMPEAEKGGTLYRTLFLAALVLFLITFLVNTVAEIVRLRFRKRAYQL